MTKCLNCEKETSNNKYCNAKCQQAYQARIKISTWYSGEWDGTKGNKYWAVSSYVRNHLLQQANNECTKCGWGELNQHTGTIPLHIDHIDGDHKNNCPDNLRVLCPNCHSLTATYAGANISNEKVVKKPLVYNGKSYRKRE